MALSQNYGIAWLVSIYFSEGCNTTHETHTDRFSQQQKKLVASKDCKTGTASPQLKLKRVNIYGQVDLHLVHSCGYHRHPPPPLIISINHNKSLEDLFS